MSRWEKTYPATPIDGAPVLAWPRGNAPPALPDGMAGVSVRIRTRPTDVAHFVESKAVGVDGRPVWHGIGRMVAVVEPGEHLVEVWGNGSVETVRAVRAGAGEIAELDYRMPATLGAPRGVLVPEPAPRWRRMGSGFRWALAPVAVILVVALLDIWREFPDSPAITAGVLGGAVLAGVLAVVVKRRADRRFRARMSREAFADPRAADTGMFLADGRCPPGIADGEAGVLLVTATGERAYTVNGSGPDGGPTVHEAAGPPWPALAIDGVPRPFCWRTWCYRLPPGRHEVAVAPACDRPAGETVTAVVEIAPGRVTRLAVHVRARITLRPGRGRAPAGPAGFAATAALQVAEPS